MSTHILSAYSFDGKGGGAKLEGDEISKMLKDKKLAWVHLDGNNPESKKWLKKEVGYLDNFVIDALIAEETSPRMVQLEEGALLILRGVNLNENEEPEDMISVRLYVDSHRIISIRRRRLRAVEDMEKKLLNGKGAKNAGQFVCMLVSRLFERMEPVLTELDDQTDNIEEKVIDKADSKLREEIVDIRKQAILFRRYMAPQRDAIGLLRMADFAWLDDKQKRQLQESYNHVTRYVEDLDAIRERSQIVKDELANILADRLNKNMYVLSVIAAIFLPLGFLTGLLGINVGGIPGADNGNSFLIFCGMLTVIVIAQVALFKKMKWF